MAGGASAPTRLGIVGVGLIGGSVGLAAARAWPSVRRLGLDRPEALAAAEAAGCIDARAASLDAMAAECDLVVLAGPIPAIVECLARWPVTSPAVLTDTGSTKREIVRAGLALPQFIAGHPLAGAERSGAAGASARLFDGRDWILTPGPDAEPEAARMVEAMVAAFGARAVRLEPDAHDRIMAYVSHVPQLVAVALMHAAHDAGALAAGLAGPAFEDMTRLASSAPALWRGILASNADHVDEALVALRAALPPDGASLDPDGAVASFASAAEARARWLTRERD